MTEIVVCSLESWDDVWRRNQFLVWELLHRWPDARVLFVEPPADPTFDVAQRRRPQLPRLRRLDTRLHAFRPLKPLPRRIAGQTDTLLRLQVLAAARALRFVRPTLWINDVTYAPLIERTGWPSVYDVTDDWLVAPLPAVELERLRELERIALDRANEVVVCSASLADTRGGSRPVTLVANAVDAAHFRRPRSRPADLPAGMTAVYVGTLHESRLDVELCIELAAALPQLSIVLVGPDALERTSRRRLADESNIHVLGRRPYDEIPGYLQHADVVIVPHVLSPFTESLDPIKAYECAVVETPTVATPVAGFRELADVVTVAPRDQFVESVLRVLQAGSAGAPHDVATWSDRAGEFARVLEAAASSV